jgi:hypothetical protein
MKKRSRIIACAIPVMIVLLGLLAHQYGYKSVAEQLASIREVEKTRDRILQKYMTIIAEEPLLERRLSLLKETRKAEESKLIEAQTLSLSAAALQQTVKGIITGRGGSISSERVEKPEELGKFRIVNVSMDLVLPDTRVLTDVVYGIETRTPYIIIRELDVRVRNFREPRDLTVKLRIAALTGTK